MSASITATLRTVATFGDFFDLRIDAPAQPRRLIDLAIPDVLDAQVERTTFALSDLTGLPTDDIPRRVVVSLVSLGIAARVVSPAIAAAVTAGVLPDLSPTRLAILDDASGRLILTLPDPRLLVGATLPDLIFGLEPLVDAFVRHGGLADRLVWGNVASAVAAAGRMVAAARPDLRAEAGTLVRSLLSGPRLDNAGHYEAADSVLDGYRRTTCCLYYQLPGAGVCGDCVFVDPPR